MFFHHRNTILCTFFSFREFDRFEAYVVQCFDEMGDFQNDDKPTLARKKREYSTKFETMAKSAPTPNHLMAMILKSHELFLERMEVNWHLHYVLTSLLIATVIKFWQFFISLSFSLAHFADTNRISTFFSYTKRWFGGQKLSKFVWRHLWIVPYSFSGPIWISTGPEGGKGQWI